MTGSGQRFDLRAVGASDSESGLGGSSVGDNGALYRSASGLLGVPGGDSNGSGALYRSTSGPLGQGDGQLYRSASLTKPLPGAEKTG